MCYIVFISHSLHWHYIKTALQENVIKENIHIINISIYTLYIVKLIIGFDILFWANICRFFRRRLSVYALIILLVKTLR